ncbi:magnesium transporter [Alkalihalobacillus sp. LMS39]|uniref:magnesium transporter n=1 Tax=Alkalihalobacillus sp. LMS39 TaxID=2924032 RepID=UPI001FB1A569|nr:magnesium transporter [Alkalihalobacillus sp. LMS39]UOE95553.1 magnesium transporter [Alkalihalobacillus sp. LMS39]
MVRLTRHTREQYTQQIVHAINVNQIEEFRNLFLELHPTDQADIFDEFSKDQRKRVYEFLSPPEFAEVFQGLDVDLQKTTLLELDDTYASKMFNDMYADDVADFLHEIQSGKADSILKAMDKEEAEDVKELLAYPPETAGAIMTKEFISITATSSAAHVIEQLRKEGPNAETIYYLYVVDDSNQLVGVVSLRDLITAPQHESIEQIMSNRVLSVTVTDDQEDVAKFIKKYDFLAAPVVTADGTLVGIVTVDDVIDVLEEETEEDFGEITAARGSLDASISSFTAAKKRAPWIIMLMFLGLITAEVIGTFEETLEAVILLAVFIPLIMDSAGNTGTQALAVVVRGLALGNVERGSIGKMLKREFGTGIMLGLICMLTLLIIVPFLYSDGGLLLAGIVGVSLFLTLSIATMVGATIPLIINKLKIDPAVASGPFITTINDILGLLIYFSIATALLDYLPQ